MGKRCIFESTDESARTSLFPSAPQCLSKFVCRLQFTTTLNFEVAGGGGCPDVKNQVKDGTNDASPFYVTLP
jgi:hypothetical protein